MIGPLQQSLMPLWQPPKVAAAASPAAGMALWWRADAGVYHDLGTTLATDGQTVAQWNDQSGNGRNATVPSSVNTAPGAGGIFTTVAPVYRAAIVNGLPAVQFTSAADPTAMSNATSFDGAAWTVFAVAALGATKGRMVSAAGNNWLVEWWSGARQQAFYNGSVKLDGTPAADTTWRCATGRSDGSTGALWENGTLIASNSGGHAGPNGPLLGMAGSGGGAAPGQSESSDGYVGELIIYASALSDSDRAATEAYLSAKWALGF